MNLLKMLLNTNLIKRKRKLIIIAGILTFITGGLYYLHCDFYKVPTSRLGLNDSYLEMPEDSFHHYINLPVNYSASSTGIFKGFYLFSPNFYKSKNITFLLTDGQMELVTTKTDFDFFEAVLRGSSYVLIGVRGHSPTLLPEVYKDGKIDYIMATTLYDSDQQVEDIEQVRLDLIKKGILDNDSKINIFGASGAGVLAQQYLSKYGSNVNRVILESTGAPDLARQSGNTYSPNFEKFNPSASKMVDSLLKEKSINKQILCNILYQKGRTEKAPQEIQLKIVEDLKKGGTLWKYKFEPITNLTLLNYMIKAPKEIAARVRWFELVGYDLMRYNSKKETNLLYEISASTLTDLLDYYKTNNIPTKTFVINRNNFKNEVLILKGINDVVFSNQISHQIKESYPNSKLLFFNDGHRMQNDKEKYIKIRNVFLNEGYDSEEFKQLIKE